MPPSRATPLPPRPLRVALVQNSAGPDPAANLRALARRLARVGAVDLLALPEVFAVRGDDDDYRRAAAPIPSDLTRWLAALAASRRCWVLAGSVLERRRDRIFNTCLVWDRAGALRARYRKIHLFEARLDDGRVIRERSVYDAGSRPALVLIEGWRCGLSICYDLRFPELYRLYADHGAHLLFAPANFTQRTGRDHWDVLVRARAIENQCFVVAPNQCGLNPRNGVASYGHSLVAGPWGEILARAGDRETCLAATLDPARLRETRGRIPVLRHRRLARVTRR